MDASFFAGGLAGLVVDSLLFPLDTVKTRIQSQEGFHQSGGFKNIYRGFLPIFLGSFPCSALFFFSYETCKLQLSSIAEPAPNWENHHHALVHLTSGAFADVVSCVVRVPIENLKQNLQANRFPTLRDAMQHYHSRGMQLYFNGYLSTLGREIPSSMVEFPLWEAGKQWITHQQEEECTPFQSALVASCSGSIAALVTNPMDVIKTRLMTSPKTYTGVVQAFMHITRVEGWTCLFRGAFPRLIWISIGHFGFFWAYEEAKLRYEHAIRIHRSG